MSRFDGKTALLTGAASGIGRATAILLASEGANVVGCDIDEAGLSATADTISGEGGTFRGLTIDISDRAACFQAVADTIEAHGGLDILANIAGIARSEHLVDVTEEQWRKMFGVNVDGMFWLCQAAIPHLLASAEAGSHGNIVNIASNAGLMGQAFTVNYCATKGAVVNLTKAMAMEFVKTPLRINAVAPGGTDTNLVANFSLPDDIDWDLMARYSSPRGFSSPDDLANVIAFVASADAKAIHGAVVSADNGITSG